MEKISNFFTSTMNSIRGMGIALLTTVGASQAAEAPEKIETPEPVQAETVIGQNTLQSDFFDRSTVIGCASHAISRSANVNNALEERISSGDLQFQKMTDATAITTGLSFLAGKFNIDISHCFDDQQRAEHAMDRGTEISEAPQIKATMLP